MILMTHSLSVGWENNLDKSLPGYRANQPLSHAVPRACVLSHTDVDQGSRFPWTSASYARRHQTLHHEPNGVFRTVRLCLFVAVKLSRLDVKLAHRSHWCFFHRYFGARYSKDLHETTDNEPAVLVVLHGFVYGISNSFR